MSDVSVVGVDTGGTFTDFVLMDEEGRIRVDKLLSNPSDPAQPVIQGLSTISDQAVHRVVHGTTVATNALLERTVATTALITTAGFEDVLEIGRQNRPILYDIHPNKPEPLTPRELRFGIDERILHDGTVLRPLKKEEALSVLQEIGKTGVQSIGVCFLHSYANPVHEKAVGEMARQLGFTVSLSCEVLPEFREYERTATVVVNACLRPVMEGYLGRLNDRMRAAHLSVMQSAGGIIPWGIAARLPVHTVLSGPAGGVIAAAEIARQSGIDRFISFDMGGTSTDVSLYDRAPSLSSEKTIGGFPIRIPVLDIHTVGAGGGSIAYRDAGGSLKVGPISAGADPGPICYGRGDRITVTDANLFLGRLEPRFFLGGRMGIHADRVRGHMERLGAELGLDALAIAEGIITVANVVMERAIRVISVERGHDPREFTLISFGGAGGLHAVELAQALNIPQVLIPRDAGVFSALGMVLADVTRDFSRTILRDAHSVTEEELNSLVQGMVRSGTEELEAEGVDPDLITAAASLDMRYTGQSYEITVPFKGSAVEEFHAAHRKLYGYERRGAGVEIVNVRTRLAASTGRQVGAPRPEGTRTRANGLLGRRKLFHRGAEVDAEVYDRGSLERGAFFLGPAIIGESTSTTFIPGGAQGAVDKWGSIKISAA